MKSNYATYTMLVLCTCLCSCAAQQTFRDGQKLIAEGKTEQGLSKLAQAYQMDGAQTDYRASYFNQRDTFIFQWLEQAERAIQNNQWDEAERLLIRVLKVDEDNVKAKTGLSRIVTEKAYTQQLSDAKKLLENGKISLAAQKVREVLSSAPSHPSALALQRAIEAKLVKDSAQQTLKAKLTQPISIEFKDAPLVQVLDSISKTAAINFMLDKDVKQEIKISLFVRDTKIEDVVRFILNTNQLDYRVLNQNTLFVYPNSPQKQRDLQELQVKSFYLTNANAKDVATMLKSIIKTKDLHVDERLNLIIMRDKAELIQVAERLVAAQDMADPEVMLDVEVLEVGANLLNNIGIQYPSQLSMTVIGADKKEGVLGLNELRNLSSGRIQTAMSNPALIVSLLHQHGNSKKLANPKIRAKNKEKAKIHIGDKLPVISNSTTSTGIISQSISYLDVGLKLDVEPSVHLNNDVAIKVGLEVSNVVKQIQNNDGSLTYQVGTRNASTTLRLKDGETQILAGLISKEDRSATNGLPLLSSLPIIGRLFGRHNDSTENNEIVLLITPHVVRNIIRPESPIEVFSSGTEAEISLERLEMNPVKSEAQQALPNNAVSEAKHENQSQANQPVNQPVNQPATLPPPVDLPQPVATPPTVEPNKTTGAAGTSKVSFFLPNQLQLQQYVTADLHLNVSNLKNAVLALSYDTKKFKVLNVKENEILKSSPNVNQLDVQVSEEKGVISILFNRNSKSSAESEITTDSLVQITFQAIEAGEGIIKMNSANLIDEQGKMVPNGELPQSNITITP